MDIDIPQPHFSGGILAIGATASGLVTAINLAGFGLGPVAPILLFAAPLLTEIVYNRIEKGLANPEDTAKAVVNALNDVTNNAIPLALVFSLVSGRKREPIISLGVSLGATFVKGLLKGVPFTEQFTEDIRGMVYVVIETAKQVIGPEGVKGAVLVFVVVVTILITIKYNL